MHIILFLLSGLACLKVALGGHLIAALVLWFLLDAALASAMGRRGFCFVNVTGTLAGSLILQRALELTFTERPVLRDMALNFRDIDGAAGAALIGQSVISRIRGIPAVNNFGTGAGDTADVDVPVTINQKKEVHYKFTFTEYNSTNRDLIDEHAQPMAVAIANHIVDAVAANWTAANFPLAPTVKAAGWDYEHLTEVEKVLADRGVPQGYRKYYIAGSPVYRALLNDTLIVAGLNNPNNAGAIMNARLPQVANLGIDRYVAIPAAGNLVAFAGTPDAVVFASRPPKNPNELMPGAQFPGNLGFIQEPRTGFTLMVNQWIDPSTLDANNRLVFIYGTAVGNSNNGHRIVSA